MNDIKAQDNISMPKLHLSNVEQVVLPNGKQYIKYFDNRQNKPIMLKTSGLTESEREQIKNLQNNSRDNNSQDTIYNATELMELRRKYVREEAILVPVDQLGKYQYLFDSIDLESRKIVSIFVKNKDRFNPPIKYINFDDCLALDAMNRVIVCQYNKSNGQYNVRYADVVKHDKKEKAVSNSQEITVNSIDYSAIIDSIEKYGSAIEVAGYMIDPQVVYQFYEYPELLARKEMEPKERYIWTKILEAYKAKEISKSNVNEKPKVLVKKDNNKKAGFASQLLTASLAGFGVGIVFAIMIAIIRNLFF